ncbi:MAG: hypothetical protein IPK96_11390 [Flammeovirgaceae bacterium]|nr:hypothetical protein [Flammeovirgaceae bacterium]
MRVVFFALFMITNVGLLMAQFMIPQTTVIKTPNGNVNHTTYSYHQMPTGSIGPVSIKYDFTIVLKDSTVLNARTRIEYKDSTNIVTVKDKNEKRIIKPSETVELFRILPDGRKFGGIATDSCWLFQCTKGKINGYSRLADQNEDHVVAIQTGDGPILPLSKDNLLDMVGEHKYCIELIEKKKFIKAIETYNKEK